MYTCIYIFLSIILANNHVCQKIFHRLKHVHLENRAVVSSVKVFGQNMYTSMCSPTLGGVDDDRDQAEN